MQRDARQEGIRHVADVQSANRHLLERALHMRAVGLLAQQKAALLTQTIFEIDRSKHALRAHAHSLTERHETIRQQQFELHARTRMLEEVRQSLEERVRARTFELEESNAALRREIAQRERAESERRLVQEQFLRAQKLELVGRLTSGIAHDFNNLLSVVLGHAELAQAGLAGTRAADDVACVIAAAQRGAALTRQLLAFARKQPTETGSLDPIVVVEDLATLIRRVLGDDIVLELKLEPNPGIVRLGVSQLEQVVMNLAVNAREAMPRGGQLSIAVRPVFRGDELPTPHGACVAISVSDTGEGMTAEVAERAFEPFFSTKTAGGGTGIGLATVDGIVREHAGCIEIESRVGKGSTITVHFPATGEDRARPDASTVASVPPRGDECVLVVDDEPEIRSVIRRFLAPLGYRVFEAARGGEALACLGRHDIDLLLVDSVLPGISGEELVREVSERWPATRIVLMSGSLGRSGSLDLAGRPLPFIAKPLELLALATMIRGVLDAAAP